MNPSRYTWIALLVGSVGMGGCYDFGNMYDQDTSYFLGPGLLTLLGLETSHCHDSFTNLLPLRLMTLPDLRKVANERGVESVVEGEVAVEDVVNIDSEEYSYREDKDTAMFYDRIKHEFFVFTNALPDRKLFMSIFEETGGDYYYIGDAASGGLEDPLNMLTNFPESRVCVDNREVVRAFLKAHPINDKWQEGFEAVLMKTTTHKIVQSAKHTTVEMETLLGLNEGSLLVTHEIVTKKDGTVLVKLRKRAVGWTYKSVGIELSKVRSKLQDMKLENVRFGDGTAELVKKYKDYEIGSDLLRDVGFRNLGCIYKWAELSEPVLRRHQWLGGGEVTIAETDEQFNTSPYVKLYLYSNAPDVEQMFKALANNNKDECLFDGSNRMVFNETRNSLSIYTEGGFGPKDKNHIGFEKEFLNIIKKSGARYKLQDVFDHNVAMLQYLSGCTILVQTSLKDKVERKMEEIDQLRYSSVFVMKDQQVHIAAAVDRNNYIVLAVEPSAEGVFFQKQTSNFKEYVLFVAKIDTNEIVNAIKKQFLGDVNQMPPTLGEGFENAKDAVIELVKSNFCRVHPKLLNNKNFRKMGEIAEWAGAN
eukprot:GHVS01068710.1.p1 GENE.GHVS01068710.1~~GHVS01068710.1.p1  ORF type:complete len:589 (+),score=46.65 GHVS01068710.1:85-1851(+)